MIENTTTTALRLLGALPWATIGAGVAVAVGSLALGYLFCGWWSRQRWPL